MKKFDVFFKNIQNDLKLYAYLMAVIFFFRLYFLIYMHGYIGALFSDFGIAKFNLDFVALAC